MQPRTAERTVNIVVIIYIVLGFIGLIIIAGLIFSIEDFIKSKKYLPINSTNIEGKRCKYILYKIRFSIKHLEEQLLTLKIKVSEVKSKGYSESEAVELLGINEVEDSLNLLISVKEKLKYNRQLEKSEIDSINKIFSGRKLTLNIIDPIPLLSKKKGQE